MPAATASSKWIARNAVRATVPLDDADGANSLLRMVEAIHTPERVAVMPRMVVGPAGSPT